MVCSLVVGGDGEFSAGHPRAKHTYKFILYENWMTTTTTISRKHGRTDMVVGTTSLVVLIKSKALVNKQVKLQLGSSV
jgi:hypothetical protein